VFVPHSGSYIKLRRRWVEKEACNMATPALFFPRDLKPVRILKEVDQRHNKAKRSRDLEKLNHFRFI
jgi:hypothetical protein